MVVDKAKVKFKGLVMEKIITSIFLLLMCSSAFADNGALKMAHHLGFYGCGKAITSSQKIINNILNKGGGGDWLTHVGTLGLQKPVTAVSIDNYISGGVFYTVVAKDRGLCSYSSILMLHRNKPCFSIIADNDDKVTSVLKENAIITKTPGGGLASFKPIDNGRKCMETVTISR